MQILALFTLALPPLSALANSKPKVPPFWAKDFYAYEPSDRDRVLHYQVNFNLTGTSDWAEAFCEVSWPYEKNKKEYPKK